MARLHRLNRNQMQPGIRGCDLSVDDHDLERIEAERSDAYDGAGAQLRTAIREHHTTTGLTLDQVPGLLRVVGNRLAEKW